MTDKANENFQRRQKVSVMRGSSGSETEGQLLWSGELSMKEFNQRLNSMESENPDLGLTGGTHFELDPSGRDPHLPGAKLDANKSEVYRGVFSYFPRAIMEVGRVSGFGARKYTWRGWETVPDGISRYSDALCRHLAYEGTGEVLDSDSGLHHAAHTAWNALARLELMLRDGRT